jgi:hypothetical protein
VVDERVATVQLPKAQWSAVTAASPQIGVQGSLSETRSNMDVTVSVALKRSTPWRRYEIAARIVRSLVPAHSWQRVVFSAIRTFEVHIC